MILGFSGKKSSGKNTAANIIVAAHMNAIGYGARVNEFGKLVVYGDSGEGVLDIDSKDHGIVKWLSEEIWPVVKLYSFADPLKQFCMDVFGLTHQQCYGTDDDKNSLTDLVWSDMPSKQNRSAKRMTAREVLQFFGTDVCRKMYGDCWVLATINAIRRDQPALAIITDVRFPNEVLGIQAEDGMVVRFTRAPFAGHDEHASEIALDGYVGFNATCDNATMSIQEQADDMRKILRKLGVMEFV